MCIEYLYFFPFRGEFSQIMKLQMLGMECCWLGKVNDAHCGFSLVRGRRERKRRPHSSSFKEDNSSRPRPKLKCGLECA